MDAVKMLDMYDANVDVMAAAIHLISTEHGFDPPSLENLPEKLMLSVSELSEALEAHRDLDKPLVYAICSECKQMRVPASWPVGPDGWVCHGLALKPEGILTEIGDSIIRNLHMMYSIMFGYSQVGMDMNVSDILNLKIKYNDSRPFKHGSKY